MEAQPYKMEVLTAVITFSSYPLFYFGYPLVAERLPGWSGFVKCSEADQIEWRTRVMSCVATSLMTMLVIPGVITGFGCESAQCRNAPSTFVSQVATGIMIGYLLFDTILVIYHRIAPMGQTLAHHLMAIIMFTVGASAGGPNFVTCWHILGEGSTPFVNMRWFLSKTPGCQSGTLMLVVGLSMLFSFAAFRVLHLPWTLTRLWMDFPLMEATYGPGPSLSLAYRALWFSAECFITTMNCFWLSKITRGALKVLLKKPSKNKE